MTFDEVSNFPRFTGINMEMNGNATRISMQFPF